ncbi:hypothetical protein FTG_0502 [Francisella tularensis subsp. novicida FTG]|uniref:DUF3281 domain-containing protein n=2 Tax=Francisella tularensis TaxID=263 RepID=A0A6I4RM46_FRATU|nr:hypothetical protein FTE_0499 [Francisella tularensis subsp. novicida FTE]EDZ90512.1 hypothetical protein FTG_0502 [Francisella tularensis subsp. novicida FTG]MWZ39404.1 DUF3281 domain-containing protein [Francisella tularensis]
MDNMIIIKKKLLIAIIVISSVAILASYSTETAIDISIVEKCNHAKDLCEFKFDNNEYLGIQMS